MTTPLLLQRLRSVHEALEQSGFEHAVGGAIALAVHTQDPRFTSDIDLNVVADPAQPQQLLDCLPPEIVRHRTAASEIRSDGQTRVHFPDPDTTLDLFLPQHEAYHRLVHDRAVETDFLGAGIKVITATDLIVFKTLFNRSKDWVDIETLLAEGQGDLPDARRWLEEILGESSSSLRRLLALAAQVGRGS